MIYTVANEQDYHFKVLFLILKKLGYSWANNCYHLSYGMVDLPTGRMKSREGTVVDADEFLNEMISTAKSISKELGKLEGMSTEKAEELYSTIGLGALPIADSPSIRVPFSNSAHKRTSAFVAGTTWP